MYATLSPNGVSNFNITTIPSPVKVQNWEAFSIFSGVGPQQVGDVLSRGRANEASGDSGHLSWTD